MDNAIDIDALRESVADVLTNECSRKIVMHHCSTQNGPLADLWQTATELGWLALPIMEDYDGLGLGLDALAPIYEEMGRVSAPLPYLSTMLAADAITHCGTEAQKAEYLPAIAAGAMATLNAPAPLAGPMPTLRRDQDTLILSDIAPHVLDGRDANLILILAKGEGGDLFRVIVKPEDNPTITTQPLWDHGHSLSSLSFNDLAIPASRAFPVSVSSEEALLSHAAIGTAAEAVGGAQGVLALTIEYLKTREQFGKPIGSFQSLKHRVADHQTQIVAARALLKSAVAKAAGGAPDAAAEASAAKAFACAAFAETARDCVQLHGGMGFTEETAVHVYLKRAHLLASLFGDAHWHNARAVRNILNAEAA